MTPDLYCQQKAARSGSSFYYSFLFLPPERRRAIISLYAFCRELDDVVDECSDPELARTKLRWWRSQVDRIYSGIPEHPVAQALTTTTRAYRLPQQLLEEFIQGMEMDLNQRRYANFPALKQYCFRAAGVVGLMSAEIFGYENPATLEYAEKLGLAFQLTNIIRDVGEDARRDRIYLPVDELARFNVSAGDILQCRESPGFQQLMEYQIERAQGYYRDAFAALPPVDRKSQRAGLVMAAIYQALLNEIRRDSSRVLTQRISLTPLRKLWIAWKTWIKC